MGVHNKRSLRSKQANGENILPVTPMKKMVLTIKNSSKLGKQKASDVRTRRDCLQLSEKVATGNVKAWRTWLVMDTHYDER